MSEHEERVEEDQLGSLTLPAGALYGARTARALTLGSFSQKPLGDFPHYLKALLLVKQAAARANREAGGLSAQEYALIEQACVSLRETLPREAFPADLLVGGGSICIHSNVNEVIANVANLSQGAALGSYAPIHPRHHVNASQSTADVCATAARLGLYFAWLELSCAETALITALQQKGRDWAGKTTLSRTCVQDALPSPLAQICLAPASALERRQEEGARRAESLLHIWLGGTVIGSGEGASEVYRARVIGALAEVSGLDVRPKANFFDGAQHADDLGAFSAELCLVAHVVMKLARDLRWLSSGPAAGLGELRLPAVMEGSSFFARKTNPVVPETVLQCGFQVLGGHRAVEAALEHAELNLNVFESSAVFSLFSMTGLLSRALHLLSGACIEGLEVDDAKLSSYENLWRS